MHTVTLIAEFDIRIALREILTMRDKEKQRERCRLSICYWTGQHTNELSFSLFQTNSIQILSWRFSVFEFFEVNYCYLQPIEQLPRNVMDCFRMVKMKWWQNEEKMKRLKWSHLRSAPNWIEFSMGKKTLNETSMYHWNVCECHTQNYHILFRLLFSVASYKIGSVHNKIRINCLFLLSFLTCALCVWYG